MELGAYNMWVIYKWRDKKGLDITHNSKKPVLSNQKEGVKKKKLSDIIGDQLRAIPNSNLTICRDLLISALELYWLMRGEEGKA